MAALNLHPTLNYMLTRYNLPQLRTNNPVDTFLPVPSSDRTPTEWVDYSGFLVIARCYCCDGLLSIFLHIGHIGVRCHSCCNHLANLTPLTTIYFLHQFAQSTATMLLQMRRLVIASPNNVRPGT